MTPRDLALAYLSKAGEDETLLEVTISNARISDGVFGFHAQQAVEKYLKAVLAVDQERPERTHDLALLAEQCTRAGHPVPDELLAALALTPFAIQERYPLALGPPIVRTDTLELVKAIRTWAEGVVVGV